MTYSVVWSGDTARELGRLEGDEPTRIRDAARWTDAALRRFPADMGEGRVPAVLSHQLHLRVWYGDVLAIYYRVDDTAMRVEVLAVGLSRRPR